MIWQINWNLIRNRGSNIHSQRDNCTGIFSLCLCSLGYNWPDTFNFQDGMQGILEKPQCKSIVKIWYLPLWTTNGIIQSRLHVLIGSCIRTKTSAALSRREQTERDETKREMKWGEAVASWKSTLLFHGWWYACSTLRRWFMSTFSKFLIKSMAAKDSHMVSMGFREIA